MKGQWNLHVYNFEGCSSCGSSEKTGTMLVFRGKDSRFTGISTKCVLFTWSVSVLGMQVQSWSNIGMRVDVCVELRYMYIQAYIICSVTLVLVMITHWHWPCTTLPSSTELEVSTHSLHIRWPSCDVHVLLLECIDQCTFNLRQLKSCILSSGVVPSICFLPDFIL